jgi:hypothetical protein
MKKLALLFSMILMAAPAHADITHKLSSSVQLTVDSAASQATRIGSTYSVSGSNITPSTVGGLGSLTSGTAVGYTPTAYGLTTDGSAYTFTEAFIEGDDVSTSTTVSSGVVGSLPATTSGGVAGSLAGTINSAGTMSLTAGGAGTSATGQFVSEILIK